MQSVGARCHAARFGFRIPRVDRRAPGRQVPYEIVREQVAERLRAGVLEWALTQSCAYSLASRTCAAWISAQPARRSRSDGVAVRGLRSAKLNRSAVSCSRRARRTLFGAPGQWERCVCNAMTTPRENPRAGLGSMAAVDSCPELHRTQQPADSSR